MPRVIYDVGIIGGGIIGCSLAREMAKRFRKVLLLEKENDVGYHTSGRNSGVVHSGFNPSPGTLKARFCVEGNQKIKLFCQERKIPFEQVGTYVVASKESQIPELYRLKERGEKNGVPGIEILPIHEVRKHEPNAKGLAALFSPTGAIVDSKALTHEVAHDAKHLGADLQTFQEVTEISEGKESVTLITKTSAFDVQLMVNCAGLHADRLAHMVGLGTNCIAVPFRGEYFVVKRSDPPIINSMVYPLPNPVVPFLGVHLTKTVTGSVLIGPNAVPAFGREAYHRTSFNMRELMGIATFKGIWKAFFKNRYLIKVGFYELLHSCSKRHFLKEASRLVLGLSLRDLQLAARVGIRPQLIQSNGHLVEDLIVETTERTIHILNVVSPGMTSALSFAEWLSNRIDGNLQWKESSVFNAA